LVTTERSNPVAGAEERKIALDHVIEQRAQFGLNSPLRRRLRVLRVAGLKRAPAQDDAGPLIKIDAAELGLLHPESPQLCLIKATEAEHGSVFFIGGNILGSDREQQEGFHAPNPT